MAQNLEHHVTENGGQVVRADIQHHSVYLGAVDMDGEELDGWVAGDDQTWAAVLAVIDSAWLRERLQVGSLVSGGDLEQLRVALGKESLSFRNIDDEDFQSALLALSDQAERAQGSLFIQ